MDLVAHCMNQARHRRLELLGAIPRSLGQELNRPIAGPAANPIEQQKSANKVWEPSRRDFNNFVGFGFAGDLNCGVLQREQLSWPPARGYCLQNQGELSHSGQCEPLAQLMLSMNGWLFV